MESGNYDNEPILLTDGLSGQGYVIGIADTGLDIYSNYFYDNVTVEFNAALPNTQHRKIVSYTYKVGGNTYGDSTDSSSEGYHGTHVCGISVGLAWQDYGDYQRFNGIARRAKIAFFDIQAGTSAITIPPNLDTDLLGTMHNMGASVFSNSWGENATSGYDTSAKSIDSFLQSHLDTLVFFAAGNEGDPNLTPAVNPVSSINTPGVFKNGLTVGAGLNDHQSWLSYTFGAADGNFNPDALAKFSSRGPTFDGRIKPEVVAPGFFVTSALGSSTGSYHTGVVGKAGTSMASPNAAAMALVVKEYFESGYYYTGSRNSSASFTPSGALLKAILIASGRQMSTIFSTYDGGNTYTVTGLSGYPSNDQGYGRVQLDKVLNFARSGNDPLSLFVVGDMNSSSPMYKNFTAAGQYHTYTFRVSSVQSVRIVLCYTDPVPASGVSPIMVNDLRVSVSGGGNTFSAYTTYANTFQVVDLTASANTVYTVNVTANTIEPSPYSGQQTYALVIVGAVTPLPAVGPNESLLQSNLSLQTIPFIPAIISMSIISFFILVAILTILIANRWPASSGFFRKIRW